MTDYYPTIGIETHVQLKTKTKLFAAVDNDARGAQPNTLISHICTGMPGALPVLNQHAVELACRAAFALNTKPQHFSKFDRKHYFYPDLPKGYQISQYEEPIILGGYIEVEASAGAIKKIELVRAHLEEDAGKNTHPQGADYSLVDLNRAGTPLLEIVSKPQIHSAAEAKAYARELFLLMKYAEVSDVDMYHGNLRFDVNISLSKDKNKLGTRAEVKNLNSFKAVESAILYEIKRQSDILDSGGQVVQETRGWDEDSQKTTGQRGKEEAHDYRYMPEPDVPPIELSDEYVKKIESELPKGPGDYRLEFKNLNLDQQSVENIIASPESTLFLSRFLEKYGNDSAEILAKWMLHSRELLIENEISETSMAPIEEEKVNYLIKQVISGSIRSNVGMDIWTKMVTEGIDPQAYIIDKNLEQVSDEGKIEKIVEQVLIENEKAADDVKNGEIKAIGYLVGQIMAKTQGKANPSLAQELIKKKLGID